MSGRRIGPYEIVEPLGSGGMGEVYRARDARLSRDVALKLLPPELAADPDRLKRFEHEARAASALAHPNIVTIHEVGREGGVPYIAMELVEGKTLREAIRGGPLPLKRALEIATCVAEGLARAHEAGIAHRDVKPENVMLGRDGVVKLLDFGLAKRVFASGASGTEETESFLTAPGAVVGTVRYMSPEQAAGRTVDFRSDQFSFGSLLYEMVSGTPAFSGDTNVDTLSAILHAEPEPLVRAAPSVPPPVRWIVERCLAKDPRERYASTADLARDLSSLRLHMSEVSAAGETAPPRRARRLVPWLFAAAGAAAGMVAAVLVLGRTREAAPPRFRQLTNMSAGITTARFTPDGESVVFSAQKEGRRPELFQTRLDHPESRSLGLPAAQILSISRTGYMAILLLPAWASTLRSPGNGLTDRSADFLLGTLAQVPLVGGTPRELLDSVSDADWAPDGKELAVVRYAEGKYRLEFPVGHPIVEHSGWTNMPRVSPDGSRVAFANVGADLFVANRTGRVVPMNVSGWEHAWSAATGEVFYLPLGSEIRAVSPVGKDRLVATLPGNFTMYDVSSNGRVLLGQIVEKSEVFISVAGEAHDRRLFDGVLEDVSPAGDVVTYVGDDLDEQPSAYIGKTDGSSSTRLGALGGYAGAILSPDGKYVLGRQSPNGLAVVDGDRAGLLLVPTGVGPVTPVSTGGLQLPGPLGFSRDGKTVYFVAAESGHLAAVWAASLEGGARRRVTPEGVRGVRGALLSNDSRSLLLGDGRSEWTIQSTATGATEKVRGLLKGEEPIQWAADDRTLYVRGADALLPGDEVIKARFYRLDPRTGERRLWKEISPVDPGSGGGIGATRFAADGKVCIYTHHRYASELFVAEGLR